MLTCLSADEVDGGDAKVEIELWDYKLRNHCMVCFSLPLPALALSLPRTAAYLCNHIRKTQEWCPPFGVIVGLLARTRNSS